MIRIEMGDVADFVDDLIRGLEQGVRTADQDPRLRRTMQEGIDDHFNRLEEGGSDPTALGGSVRWTQRRAPVTAAARSNFGIGQVTPLLQVQGQMRKDYTQRSNLATKHKTGKLNRQALRVSDKLTRLKAERHHEGGVYRTIFPYLSAGSGSGGDPIITDINFPQRPFLYWDKEMEEEITNVVGENLTKWIAHHLKI